MKTSCIISRLGIAAAALAGVLVLAQPVPAFARGGGGSHGGGFHGGSFHDGGFRGAHFIGHPGRGRGVGGWGWGGAVGLGGLPFLYDWGDYPYYGDYAPYDANGAMAAPLGAAPEAYWYYCQSPAGYYPYVAQCNSSWQPVPVG